jgi:uncharacterized protein DUF3768
LAAKEPPIEDYGRLRASDSQAASRFRTIQVCPNETGRRVAVNAVRIHCAPRRRGGRASLERIVKTIAVFDDFCHANDPHEEHDFGSFEADGHMIMFKIDYFDQSMSMHSPAPTDTSVTKRVITIMLAEEY